MPTLVASGTLSTSASEQTLATIAAPGVYQLVVDTSALIDGEILIPRCRRRVLADGSERLAQIGGLSDALWMARRPIQQSEPIVAPHGCAWSLQQPLGSARSVPWAIWRIGTPYILGGGTFENAGTLTATATLQTFALSVIGNTAGMSFDVGGLVEGEVLLLQVLTGVLLSGGTQRVLWEEIFNGVQIVQAVQTPPFLSASGISFKYQRVGPSANFSFDYSLEHFAV